MPPRRILRKTKIVATLGPACDDEAVLRAMIGAGANVVRLNLSHGTLEEHARRLGRAREAAASLDVFVAAMVDTKGIEVRTGTLAEPAVTLSPGAEFRLYAEPRSGDAGGVSTTYPSLVTEVLATQRILIDDGAIELEVLRREPGALLCRVVVGGTLRERKSINLPDTRLPLGLDDPAAQAVLRDELAFAADHEVEYIAASFVQRADDVHAIRAILREHGATIPIVAKIENQSGVDNLEGIVEAADGTMVARGDLGVELPLADVPGTQKRIIRATVYSGKPVITATQMLDSMERNPRPTRAEASDVANAILDGTSAVMLSGETAMGKYPVEAVATMAALSLKAESYLRDYGYLQKTRPNPANRITEAVSQAAVTMAQSLGAAAIISLTTTGFTSRQISKHRPDCPILAVTSVPLTARRLAMNWGVTPLLCAEDLSDLQKIEFAIESAKTLGHLQPGDLVVATAGFHQRPGTTDQIRVFKLDQGAQPG
jgi:pyruvate kinase